MSNPSSNAGYPPVIRYAQTPGVHNPDYLDGSASGTHNTSRLSHLSHDSHASHASTINLGGRDYNIGTRVGKSFVIGDPYDPRMNDDTFDDLNVSKTPSTLGSGTKLTPKDKYPVLEKAYDFEHWNWTVIRFLCFLMVILTMVALLAAVIGLIIVGKTKCTSPFKWWQGSFTYHVSVPHFCKLDEKTVLSDYGDLAGLQDKIAYFKYLNVETVVLSNIFPAQEEDKRWDLFKSYTKIDERLGTVNEFISMVEEFHGVSIRVLIELDTSHTSTLHDWFEDSRKNRPAYNSIYNNFYFWREDETAGENGTWILDPKRLEYYRYLSDTAKPRLNWDTELLHEKFLDEMRTWLRRGVDGFVMNGVQNMMTSSPEKKLTVIQGWRSLLDEYTKDDTDRKILSIEKSAIDALYGGSAGGQTVADQMLGQVDLLEVPFSLKFDNLTYKMQGDVEEGLRWQRRRGGPWTSWKLGSLKTVDVSYRTATMLYLLTLPGNPAFVAGQEIGRNILEEKDPTPLIWHVESVFPYVAGSQLNESTIAIWQSLSKQRLNAYSLKEDGMIEDEESYGDAAKKVMSHSFPAVDKESVMIRRQYKRRDAYYFAGNFGKSAIIRDWFDVVAQGVIISDSSKKFSGSISFAGDLTLQQGQGIVFKVPY